MQLDKIVSIPGKPGLFEIITQTRAGFVAQSLLDGKKISIAFKNNISVLNEIAIYTYEEEIPLRIVLKTIGEKENGQPAVSPKESEKVLTSYFREILPNFDEERVYTSNIKKVLTWYNLLASKNFDFTAIQEVEEETTEQ